jgi:hypothetical protein
MRTPMRCLALLGGILAVGGATTEAASAGTLLVRAKIAGAGKIEGHVRTPSESFGPCSQARPVSDITQYSCDEWQITQGNRADVKLTATPADGWKFSKWENCSNDSGANCNMEIPAGLGTTTKENPRAVFYDDTAPRVQWTIFSYSRTVDGRVSVAWDADEPGATFRCGIRGGSASPCTSPATVDLPVGVTRYEITPRDPSGNVGAATEVVLQRFDTTIDVGPAEGAHVANGTAPFVARSAALANFECTLDGTLVNDCGRAGADGRVALRLPALADGKHTLSLRSGLGGSLDLSPATRTWTVDTVAPDTTLTENAGALALASNEQGGTFKCRIDGEPVTCDSRFTLPDLAAGRHTFEAAAVDRAGNVDPTPASHRWSIAAPAVAPAAATTPLPQAATTPRTVAALKVTYRYKGGRLTKLAVTGATGPIKVTVKRPGKRATSTTIKKLVGSKLPKRTKITVRAGSAARTITLR